MNHLPLLALMCVAIEHTSVAQSLDLTHTGIIPIGSLGSDGIGGIAFDESDGTLWVADGTVLTNVVEHIQPATGAVLASFNASVVPGLVAGPDALALDPISGDLLLFSAANPVVGGRVTSSGSLVVTFNLTLAVTAASFSNSLGLFVIGTEGGTRRLCRMNSNDGTIFSSVDLSGLGDGVIDMDFDSSTGKLYCLLESQNVLVELDVTSGAVVSQTTLSSDLTAVNNFNAGMAFNASANVLYISKGSLSEADKIHVFSRELETAYCFGDGTLAPCPCGNIGSPNGGCANSVFASGAHLSVSGNSLVSQDNAVLRCSGVPPNASALFFQGTTPVGSGSGSAFGDGLRCAGGTVIRLGIVVSPSGGTAQYPGPGAPQVSVRGLIPATGGLRFYQAWYRNSANFCTASTFNLSNGVRLLWAP